jgi:hypothetical protein
MLYSPCYREHDSKVSVLDVLLNRSNWPVRSYMAPVYETQDNRVTTAVAVAVAVFTDLVIAAVLCVLLRRGKAGLERFVVAQISITAFLTYQQTATRWLPTRTALFDD